MNLNKKFVEFNFPWVFIGILLIATGQQNDQVNEMYSYI